MDQVSFWSAPDVEKIARDLINDIHKPLQGHPLICIFRSKAKKSKGNIVRADISLLKGKNAFLAETDEGTMLIETAKDEWDELRDEQKIALIDHELCHVVLDLDTAELALRGHDFEEFTEIIDRRGFWSRNLQEMGKVAKVKIEQGDLFADTKVSLTVDGETVDTDMDTLDKLAAAH